MKKLAIVAVAAASMTASACATSYTMTPHPTDGQTVRYVQGRATIFAEGTNGAVQVTALGPNEKGRLLYSVAAQNRSQEVHNFGTENVSLSANGAPVRVFSYNELERMAKNDATTAMVLMALAGGVAAASAYSGPTSTSTTHTPYGTYHTSTTNYAAQAVAASAATAATAVQMRQISDNLDGTLANLGMNVLQTTTIDPDDAFGGQVIADRVAIPKAGELGTTLTVRFAGEEYVVNFGISQQK